MSEQAVQSIQAKTMQLIAQLRSEGWSEQEVERTVKEIHAKALGPNRFLTEQDLTTFARSMMEHSKQKRGNTCFPGLP